MATEGALCVEETAVSQDSDKSLLAPIFFNSEQIYQKNWQIYFLAIFFLDSYLKKSTKNIYLHKHTAVHMGI